MFLEDKMAQIIHKSLGDYYTYCGLWRINKPHLKCRKTIFDCKNCKKHHKSLNKKSTSKERGR